MKILRNTFLFELKCRKRAFVDETIQRSIVANIINQKVADRDEDNIKVRNLQIHSKSSETSRFQLDNIRNGRPEMIATIPVIEAAIKIIIQEFERSDNIKIFKIFPIIPKINIRLPK
jgi:hypothetical protein